MSYKILVIEDDQYLGELVTDALQLSGYSTHLAMNGIEGLDCIHRINPDLVLCDITMPLLDGMSLVETIRKDYRYDDLPFIFMTARSSPGDVRTGMSKGADDYMTKPFTVKELLQTVESRLKRVKKIQLSAQPDRAGDNRVLQLIDSLTKSEKNIIKLIANGLTTEQIAQNLHVSPKTIENHRHNITLKMDLKGKNSLMQFALANKNIISEYR
jgi:DNA-binding NarL/FixJ family response regulator